MVFHQVIYLIYSVFVAAPTLSWQMSQRNWPTKFLREMQPVQRAELATLTNLRNRSDVVIRYADKGGAFEVCEKELYLNEADQQLSDRGFYQRTVPEGASKRNKETVEAFITQAFAKEELPQLATNLIVYDCTRVRFPPRSKDFSFAPDSLY